MRHLADRPIVDRLPTRRAAAIVITGTDGSFLSVRRPREDRALGDVWGLPAVDMTEGEDWEDAARRVGRQKLGIEVEITSRIGDEKVERDRFLLHLTEFSAAVVAGEPSVPQADRSITQYVDLIYARDPRILIPAARRGSACSRIFLRSRGLSW